MHLHVVDLKLIAESENSSLERLKILFHHPDKKQVIFKEKQKNKARTLRAMMDPI